VAEDGRLRKLLMELRPHAIWEVLRWVLSLAGSAMIVALAALVQKSRNVSLDWVLFGGIFVVSLIAFIGVLYVAKTVGQISEQRVADEANAAIRSAEQRIANLERKLSEREAARESTLPALRPKIVPFKWGRTPDNHTGLFVRNDGEPAFDVSIEEPVLIGRSKLQFWNRIHPGLTKADGQLLIEANIELATGYALTADGLRGEMIKGDLDAITLKIRYGDMDGQKWVTSCEVVREVWGDGMRVSGVRQERAS
jgi:hypothetical protein